MLYQLFDTLFVERENNLTLPPWVDDNVMSVRTFRVKGKRIKRVVPSSLVKELLAEARKTSRLF